MTYLAAIAIGALIMWCLMWGFVRSLYEHHQRLMGVLHAALEQSTPEQRKSIWDHLIDDADPDDVARLIRNIRNVSETGRDL